MSAENGQHSFPYWNNLSSEEQLKIFAAVNRLAKDNPDVVKHLTGLADVKENRPGTWKAGLKFLKL